ncbi:MAG: hypothetical protein BGO49_22875 [Planctomycetales bacterium 71-10]|nr:MAG: hypothetical protein BGO49_22875 [Planctomycetales bacterium 71-10]
MEDLMRVALTNALAAAALAAAVAGLSLALARRPAVVHALWILVLLKLVTPPLFEVSVGRFEVAGPAAEVAAFVPAEEADFEGLEWAWADSPEVVTLALAIDPAEAEGPEPWPIDAATAWKLLGGAWLAGSLATAALAGFRIVRFQRRLRDASPAGYAVEDEVAELSAEMGLRRPPLVDFIDARTTPMLWGLGVRPRLILPRMLWKGLDSRRRTLLLTHELAHLKRGDHLLRFFELAVTVLYWWLPVVWWARKALRDVEEQCCDAWVVWMFPDDARAYAETLLDTVDFLNPGAEPAPLLASGFGKVHHLRKRLTMVMKGTTPRTLGWKGSLGAITLAGALLPIAPTWAQKAPEGDEAVAVTVASDAASIAADVATVTSDAVSLSGDVAITEAAPADVVTFAAVARDGETVSLAGDSEVAASGGAVTVVAVADDEKGKDKDEGDKKKDKVREEIRFQFRGAPDQAREGIKKAVEELKGKIQDLESKDSKEEGAEIQIKALKSALEALEKMASKGQDFDVKFAPGDEKNRLHVFGPGQITSRMNPNDPKFVEAQKQVKELQNVVAEKQNVLAEKQKELVEAEKKLVEAARNLAKLRGDVFKVSPDVNARVAEIRSLQLMKELPRVAEGRAIIRTPGNSEEKARIDVLEQKLDKVLQQLEGLKKPEAEEKK